MLRGYCCLALASLAVFAGACDGQIDFEGILQEVADRLAAPEGATGEPSVLQLSNVSPQSMNGTIEVFYTLSDGSTTRSSAFVEVPPDFAATFDVGCPSSIRFTGNFGESPFSLTVQRGVDYECGSLLEFAAGPGLVVQFVHTAL